MSKNYFHAIATLIGTIIGVGIFTIPYVINKAGILPLIVYIIVLGFVQYVSHLYFAEVVLSVKTRHRIPGYAQIFFGRKFKMFAFIASVLGFHGTILAYIIAGGTFLQELVRHIGLGPEISFFSFVSILFIIEALIVWAGIKMIASTELAMSGLLIFLVALIGWRGWEFINFSNYSLIDLSNVFLPYGPIFFAVGGTVAIPSVCELLSKEKNKIKSAISWATFISVAINFIFALIIVGITGINTTPDALAGLGKVMGDGIIVFSLIFGLLAVITSFIVVVQALHEVYWLDFKINKNLAWALACGLPYLLFLVGFQNLTKVVGLTGAIMGGLINIALIILVFGAKKKAEQDSVIKNKINKPIAYGLSLIYILGLLYEVWQTFK